MTNIRCLSAGAGYLLGVLLSFFRGKVGDGHTASSESKTAGGAERRRRFAIELKKILESGGDAAVPPKGGRTSLLEVAAGAVGGLSRACSGEMQVRAVAYAFLGG